MVQLATKLWPGFVAFFVVLFIVAGMAEDAPCLQRGTRLIVNPGEGPPTYCQEFAPVLGIPANAAPVFYATIAAIAASIISWIIQSKGE